MWPSEYGTVKPFWFIVSPKYWGEVFGCFTSRLSTLEHMDTSRSPLSPTDGRSDHHVPVEPVTENLAAQVAEGKCVDIVNLRKGFTTTNGYKVAVDGLNLTMYSGQITALLGHNGAGKSTAISMLTGLIPPDSGSAVIEGLDIKEDMAYVRTFLGVCPQHDILFSQLTVEEHLYMYARFKGTPADQVAVEVEKMINSVGLTEKRKVYSMHLSGGQKRKLSVGIAFIGNSRVVFLDEPTSGMDPYSRRFTWNVIRQYKEGRIVVLTTHFMDEADLLGDRIAIMGDGRLLCCGSSLYLKQRFGVGYNMTVEKLDANNFDSVQLERFVCTHVPEAKVLTDVGTEMTFQLPFSASGKFQRLFEAFDVAMKNLGLQSYGVSVTTLEEVFIKVAHSTTTHAVAAQGKDENTILLRQQSSQRALSQTIPDGQVNLAKGRQTTITPSSNHFNDNHHHYYYFYVFKDEESLKLQKELFRRVPDNDHMKIFKKHMHAMFVKRLLYTKRDPKSWFFQFFAPVVLLLLGKRGIEYI